MKLTITDDEGKEQVLDNVVAFDIFAIRGDVNGSTFTYIPSLSFQQAMKRMIFSLDILEQMALQLFGTATVEVHKVAYDKLQSFFFNFKRLTAGLDHEMEKVGMYDLPTAIQPYQPTEDLSPRTTTEEILPPEDHGTKTR